jgi:hypothetical protein
MSLLLGPKCAGGGLALILTGILVGPASAHPITSSGPETVGFEKTAKVQLAQPGVTVRWLTKVNEPNGRFLLAQGRDHTNLVIVWEGDAKPGIHSYSYRDPRTVLAAGLYRLVFQDRFGFRWVVAQVTVEPRPGLDSDATLSSGPNHHLPAVLAAGADDLAPAMWPATTRASAGRAELGNAPPKPPP